MDELIMPEPRAAVAVDIEDYSSRNDVQQYHLQEALIQVLNAAARTAGLDRSRWEERQPQGDGEFAWLPPQAHIAVLVGPFIRELHVELGTHNRRRAGNAWTPMRLRVALHFGPVRLGAAAGVAGRHAVQLGRLLDSPPIRCALDTCRSADLALIVSDRLYEDYISQGLGNPDEYRRVHVEMKRQRYTGYVHVPGHDMRTLAVLDSFDGPETDDGPDQGGRTAPRLPHPTDPSGGTAARMVVHGDQIAGASHRAQGNGVVNIAGRDQRLLPARPAGGCNG